MHIPDGFLSAPVAAGTAVVSAAAVGQALNRTRLDEEPGLAPRMGVTAAYIFAAQMVNFPVMAGTSGHLLGALLAAILLGPHAAAVVMTAVFLIQAFFFLDGGHTALGANVLNMGLAGTYGGFWVYRLLAGSAPERRRCLLSAAAAAWASVMLGAALTSWELSLSGAVATAAVFPAMLGVHALIGAGEAAITVSAIGLLWKVRPDLLTGRDATGASRANWLWLLLGLVMVALLAPLASSSPDGLERVAQALGFETRASPSAFPGPFPDYSLPGTGAGGWMPAAVSLLGCVLSLGALLAAERLRRVLAKPGNRRAAPVIDARVRLGCMLGLVLSGVLLPVEAAGKVLLLFGVAAGWALMAKVSARWLAGRALLLLPFVGLAALSSPLLHAGGFGMGHFGLIFLRAGTSLLATAAFLSGTPEPSVMAALRAYHLPRGLAETVSFALRYLRVLREDTTRMLQARAARGVGAGTLLLRAGAAGGVVGTLFVRSFERAERISMAMAARGYRGELPAAALPRLSAMDGLFGAGFALLMVGVWLWR